MKLTLLLFPKPLHPPILSQTLLILLSKKLFCDIFPPSVTFPIYTFPEFYSRIHGLSCKSEDDPGNPFLTYIVSNTWVACVLYHSDLMIDWFSFEHRLKMGLGKARIWLLLWCLPWERSRSVLWRTLAPSSLLFSGLCLVAFVLRTSIVLHGWHCCFSLTKICRQYYYCAGTQLWFLATTDG